MRKNNIFLSVVLVSVNVFTAPAADNTLTLSQCLELAKEHNKSVVAAKYQADAAESALPESVTMSSPADISGRPKYQMLEKKVQAASVEHIIRVIL